MVNTSNGVHSIAESFAKLLCDIATYLVGRRTPPRLAMLK